MHRSVPLSLLICTAVLAVAPPALARNETFTLSVPDAFNKTRAHEIVGDMPVRFGAASAAAAGSADLVRADMLVEGIAAAGGDDPRQHRIGPPLTDDERCVHAFDDALGKLVAGAREAGATAIAGVMSDYKGEGHALRDGTQFECHAGAVRSYVWLRAQFVRGLPVARALPPATGFAKLDDVDAVPLGDAGKERYRHFLTLPGPRAFVVYEDGNWRFYSKDPEAASKALDYCARQGKRCWLYAADDRVLWNAEVDKRIGSAAQLGSVAALTGGPGLGRGFALPGGQAASAAAVPERGRP